MSGMIYRVLVVMLLLGAATPSTAELLTVYDSKAPFADVVADLEDAVVNRGYVIDYRGRIGDMLARTANDVGAPTTPLYRAAQFVQFCSATLSRKAMEADITNIGYCPYVLFVYETEKAPGTVTVGFRRLPEGSGRDEINNLLDEIVREAAGR